MKNIDMSISDTDDKELFYLEWEKANPGTATDAVTLRLHNNETSTNTTVNYLRVVRADFLENKPSSEDSNFSLSIGTELVQESWLEARAGTSGTWTPINAWTNKLDLGAIVAGSYTTFQVRLNVPADASTTGSVGFCIGILSR